MGFGSSEMMMHVVQIMVVFSLLYRLMYCARGDRLILLSRHARPRKYSRQREALWCRFCTRCSRRGSSTRTSSQTTACSRGPQPSAPTRRLPAPARPPGALRQRVSGVATGAPDASRCGCYTTEFLLMCVMRCFRSRFRATPSLFTEVRTCLLLLTVSQCQHRESRSGMHAMNQLGNNECHLTIGVFTV